MKPVLRLARHTAVAAAFAVVVPPLAAGDLADVLRTWDATVVPADSPDGQRRTRMLADDARDRIRAANRRESRAWHEIKARADWEKYRDARLAALRASLGTFPPAPKDLRVRVTGRHDGDGCRVENLTFESRPGVVVTANLYVPSRPGRSMPGLVLCHSHHNPKSQGELQDMGRTWARQGCLVLVPDQLGHGERRQHPFVRADQYPGPFRLGRQDYFFRYNTGLQLHLVGDSLIGWMAWDLMRGVDLLLARPGIDKDRIILLGSVAGGGDPAAVAAALDPRVTAVVPFNFGGPQPETAYPLPADAEERFNYAGGGSWESTRNLRLSARDGFLPWVIVGAAAPRPLVYAHEFAWDRTRDPVWARLEKIYAFCGAGDRLASVHGRGGVKGQPPESTHCNNIGPEHRRQIYPALARWFGMEPPAQESTVRLAAEDLNCLKPGEKPRPLHELAAEIGAERAAAYRKRLAGLDPKARRQQLRRDWVRLLGDVEPKAEARATAAAKDTIAGRTAERVALEVEPAVVVPVVLLLPPRRERGRAPVVVAFAQEGKQGFLKHRADAVALLLQNGVAVCLPDLRGTGETRPGGDRGRQSAASAISATELVLGQTLVGSRLRDLRAVLRYLRSRPELDGSRLALWGDSFAAANPADYRLDVPLDADPLPAQSEPLGGLLALFGALFEDDVRAVYGRGGLTGYQSILQSPFCYVPHDAIVPGALTAGDLCDVAAALAPRPLRLEALVDGLNRQTPADVIAKTYEPARTAYRGAAVDDRLLIETGRDGAAAGARWLLTHIQAE